MKRVNELSQAIEARKKMMKKIGYGNGDDKRLEQQVKVARARYAELQEKFAKKQQLKDEQECSADLNAKSKPKKKRKKQQGKPREYLLRSSSRRRTSRKK